MKMIHEECGVFGVFCPDVRNVAGVTYYGLFALQHRGQQSCGIVVNDDGVFASRKGDGLLNDVFSHETLGNLPQGRAAIGHVRYGTADSTSRDNCQPLEVNHMKGHMALAHNGSLVNAYELREEMESRGAIFHTNSDAETIAYVITGERLTAASIEEAVERAMDRLEGAYSLAILSPTKMIAARDPRGIRPLCYGRFPDGAYVVASESCALQAIGAEMVRDVRPGEVVVFEDDGGGAVRVRSLVSHCGTVRPALCVFEYIYFSRPDSVVEGLSVHEARANAGRFLARTHPVDADVVIGVPDSGLDAAMGYASESGIPYELGFIKNRYIGRTFIAPGQDSRMDLVKIKLNPIAETVRGKRVVMVDDSIVRGTTCRQIVSLLRQVGATEVHMRVSSPPFLHPCYYGTDIDSEENLIATHHTVEEIAEIIGVDSLGFLDMGDTARLDGGTTAPDRCGYCMACFDGIYPTRKPNSTAKSRFECKLSKKRGTNE